MPAAFSFPTSLRRSSHVAGGELIPAFVKRSLLYQNPTTPRLYGMPYCLPFTGQLAAALPSSPIQGLTSLVMSSTLPAATWVASWPPPHCWYTSGGVDDWRATGILVLNCSFCIGTTLTVMFGCDLWNSFATVCQNDRPGSVFALCHHVRVTSPDVDPLELWVLPPHAL